MDPSRSSARGLPLEALDGKAVSVLEHALYRLFVAQYANRANLRRAGFFRRTFDFWVFTNEENNRILDSYVPINEFIGRLGIGRLIRRRGEPIGEFEFLPPPTSRWYPLAYIDS